MFVMLIYSFLGEHVEDQRLYDAVDVVCLTKVTFPSFLNNATTDYSC